MSTALLDAPPFADLDARAPAVDPEVEFALCRSDPAYLINHYGVIDGTRDDADDATGEAAHATVPFRLWPSQVPVLWTLWQNQNVIILKARQLGISWLVCGYIAWLCTFRPGRKVLIFSKGQRESNEMLRRVRVIFQNLPVWLRDRLPALVTDNTRELLWGNGSRVQTMPATSSAGVSYTADLIVMDEAAKGQMRTNGSKLYAAAKPTVDAGGQVIILSTAEGLGGFFHGMWTKAVKGVSNFRTVFLPWWSRPGRDWAWYQDKVANADDPRLIPQEYPGNPMEAFVASGRLRFDPGWVVRQSANLREPILRTSPDPDPTPPAAWPKSLLSRGAWAGRKRGVLPFVWEVPRLKVYEPFVDGCEYVVAADVAEGKDPEGKNDPDYCAAVVFERNTWREAALLHGRWEPDLYALYLMCLSEAWGGAPVVVERNNHGHAVLVMFKTHEFPVDRVACGHDGWPGWLTNVVTKPLGTDLVASALRQSLMAVRSLAGMNELHVYTVGKKGTTGAPPGEHDDIVMAWNIGLSWVRQQAHAASSAAPAEVGGRPRAVARFLG